MQGGHWEGIRRLLGLSAEPPAEVRAYRRAAAMSYQEEPYRAGLPPRAAACLAAARWFTIAGDQLAEPAFAGRVRLPAAAREQVLSWYRRVPDLLAAARREGAGAGTLRAAVLPVRLGSPAADLSRLAPPYVMALIEAEEAAEAWLEAEWAAGGAPAEARALLETARVRLETARTLLWDGEPAAVPEAVRPLWDALSHSLAAAQEGVLPGLWRGRDPGTAGDPWTSLRRRALELLSEAVWTWLAGRRGSRKGPD